MTSRDPRLRPALERSWPGDAVPGSTRPVYPQPWSFQFGGSDGRWRNVTVRAYATDKRGRTIVNVEWHIGSDTGSSPDTLSGSFVADRARMRKRW